MSAAQPDYWIKGEVSPDREVLIAAVNKDESMLYVLTYCVGQAIAKDSGVTLDGSRVPLLVFDPRPLAQLGQVASARILNSSGTKAQLLLANSPSPTHHAVSTQKAPSSDMLVAVAATNPATFTFVEQTGIALKEIRAEGRYVLKTADGAEVEWYRYLPVSAKIQPGGKRRGSSAAAIQRTVRNVPYVGVTSGNLRLVFIPAALFAEGGTAISDPTTLLRYAKAHADHSAAPRAFTSPAEAEKGAWYAVCRNGKGCGSCFGGCPGGATCAVHYDKKTKKIRYGCGISHEEAEWYENWWILLMIGVIVIVVLVVILMMAVSQTSGRRQNGD